MFQRGWQLLTATFILQSKAVSKALSCFRLVARDEAQGSPHLELLKTGLQVQLVCLWQRQIRPVSLLAVPEYGRRQLSIWPTGHVCHWAFTLSFALVLRRPLNVPEDDSLLQQLAQMRPHVMQGGMTVHADARRPYEHCIAA